MDLISRFSFSSSKSCTQNDFQFSQYLSNTWRNKLNPLVNHIGRRKHIRVFLENCSRRSRLLLLFTFHLSFTIFIELLAQTDRTSRYPVTGKGRKHTFLFLRQTIFSIFLFSRYYLYLSTSSREWIEFYKHYGGKRAYIFFFFFDFPRPVEFRKAAIVGIVISHIYEAVHKRRSFVKLRVQIRA